MVIHTKDLDLTHSLESVLRLVSVDPLDVRASVGKNLIYLRSESSLDPWYASPSDLRAALNDRKAHVSLVDRWRLGYLARLLQERGQLYYESKDTGSHTSLIDSLCIN